MRRSLSCHAKLYWEILRKRPIVSSHESKECVLRCHKKKTKTKKNKKKKHTRTHTQKQNKTKMKNPQNKTKKNKQKTKTKAKKESTKNSKKTKRATKKQQKSQKKKKAEKQQQKNPILFLNKTKCCLFTLKNHSLATKLKFKPQRKRQASLLMRMLVVLD